MTLRRTQSFSVLLLAAVACGAPSVPQQASPGSVVTALFDPTQGQLPLPNDLLLRDPGTLPVPAAERELLTTFQQQGGFPSDQEVPVTIDFRRTVIAADGSTSSVAPQLDTTSINRGNVFVVATAGGAQGEIALDPVKPTDYVTYPDHGTLTLHNAGHKPWVPGSYAVLVRGGPSGVKTVEGDPVYPSQIFYLIAQGQDLTTPANIGLIKAQAGSQAAALAQAQQLNGLIAAYQPAFAAADTRFPHQELAILDTFHVAPAVTQVQLDPGRGLVPLPIDLLRDPRPASATCAACGRLTPVAACTLAATPLASCLDANGNPKGAAAGFAALDGFSTTAAILAPTSLEINASTVTKDTVALYDLSNPAAPAKVDPSTLILEPCEFTASGLAQAVAIQPAGATSCDPTSVFRTRPLKDATDYAVVITDGVKDKAGNPLGRGTVGSIVLFDNALVDGSGKSQLTGIDDGTAYALEVMRQKLVPVRQAAGGKAHIAMAYTFHTQTILSTATKLGALPYSVAAANPASTLPGAVVTETAAAAFSKYGVNPKVPNDKIAEIVETTIVTQNLLDPASGAFNPDPTKAQPETIKVILAVPALQGATPPLVAPMVVLHHGLGRGRLDMLTIANTFAAAGMVTVAIDAPKHGDRSFCTPGGSAGQCAVGTCKSALPAGAQGDAAPPGLCVKDDGSPGAFAKAPVGCGGDPSCLSAQQASGEGIPVVSSNYFVSANFFRTRDTMRQDIIDQSQLVLDIAANPRDPNVQAHHTVFQELASKGVIIDPTKVYFTGQSLGSIEGTADVAANPRISKAVLNVGGGTVVDVFTNSPAFKTGVGQLLAGLNITPGTASYLQFLVVAKTILDPADPINFAQHLTANTLPNLIPPLGGATDGSVPQAPKKVLTQAAFCDQVVPNPFNFLLDSSIGTGPLLLDPTFGAPGTFQLFYKGNKAPTAADLGACKLGSPPPASAVTHGFLLDFSDPLITGQAQGDAASFLVADKLPNSLVVLP